MTIDEMKELKRNLGLTNSEIAELAHVPFSTVQKVFSGTTSSPRKKTLQALDKALRLADSLPSYLFEDDDSSSSVAEVAHEYEAKPKKRHKKIDINNLDRQGKYTLDDYYSLPDDVRAELIDGFLYIMETPTSTHQKVILYVTTQILPCVEEHPECELLFSPIDVQLDCDDRTMVQPDLLVLCNREKDTIKNIYGAPDFVMEVASPSTRKHDMMKKLDKYGHAGVREYWIVDPEKETITKYDFTKDMELSVYTFEDTVSLAIFDGKCEVDFKEVKRHLL